MTPGQRNDFRKSPQVQHTMRQIINDEYKRGRLQRPGEFGRIMHGGIQDDQEYHRGLPVWWIKRIEEEKRKVLSLTDRAVEAKARLKTLEPFVSAPKEVQRYAQRHVPPHRKLQMGKWLREQIEEDKRTVEAAKKVCGLKAIRPARRSTYNDQGIKRMDSASTDSSKNFEIVARE